jgi:hypothetical protein
MFLMGPVRQIVKMFEKGRLLATLVYIAAMFLTLFSAIKVCLSLCGLSKNSSYSSGGVD